MGIPYAVLARDVRILSVSHEGLRLDLDFVGGPKPIAASVSFTIATDELLTKYKAWANECIANDTPVAIIQNARGGIGVVVDNDDFAACIISTNN